MSTAAAIAMVILLVAAFDVWVWCYCMEGRRPKLRRRLAIRARVRTLGTDVPLGFFEIPPRRFTTHTLDTLTIEGRILLYGSQQERAR